MIKVEHLSKQFGETRAVDDVSFTINRGEVVGFLGPNGAGKTTTMRLLTHYLFPDAGRVEINGFDLDRHSLEVRRNIGYLPESAPLYHDLSVLEYLEYMAAIRRLSRGQRGPRIAEMLKVCGLEEVVRKDVGVLSKGFRQRVGLAQAMIHAPDILILDEPTTGLDPNQIVEIRELIKTIGQERTIILSTHILSEVQATCSRVLIINNGRIVADDTAAGLAAQLQNESACFMRLRGDPLKIEEALGKAGFVTGFDRLEEDEASGYRVRGSSEDLGEELFKLAVEHGFTLQELRKESFSLEKVFARLTQEEPS